jgi:hypothetical protein
MFNALDSCLPWPAKKTAKYLASLDDLKRKWEFSQVGRVVLLTPLILDSHETNQPYAIFFDDRKSCLVFIKLLQD